MLSVLRPSAGAVRLNVAESKALCLEEAALFVAERGGWAVPEHALFLE